MGYIVNAFSRYGKGLMDKFNGHPKWCLLWVIYANKSFLSIKHADTRPGSHIKSKPSLFLKNN
jgi:hypothetical protein